MKALSRGDRVKIKNYTGMTSNNFIVDTDVGLEEPLVKITLENKGGLLGHLAEWHVERDRLELID